MIYSDSIIEKKSVVLENLDSKSSLSERSSTSYNIYNVTYTKLLEINRIYYVSYDYRYVATGTVKPTWVKYYIQGAYVDTTAAVQNPISGTLYNKISCIFSNVLQGPPNTRILDAGLVYHGPQNQLTGVTGYVKNFIIYDVTELYYTLLAQGKITNYTTCKTWCDNNLVWKAPGVKYDVTNLVNDSTNIKIKNGKVIDCEIVECDGMEKYAISNDLKNGNTYFDSSNHMTMAYCAPYENPTTNFTSMNFDDSQKSPFYPQHKKVIKFTALTDNKEIGFYKTINSYANAVFIQRFVAKVPVGFKLNSYSNNIGTGGTKTWLTSNSGTGNWEEYAVIIRCGSSGTFSTAGFIAMDTSSGGYVPKDTSWWIAYHQICDITGNEHLANYSALSNKSVIKGCNVFDREFNTRNLILNGDGSNTNMKLPTGWSWDTTDVAGNAKASIVLAVGASGTATDTLGLKYKINPNTRYKFSCWVKCKRSLMKYYSIMTIYYVNDLALPTVYVGFKSGTKTQLTKDLVAGDTYMLVSSNANWASRSYANVGVRTNNYSSYNNYNTGKSYNCAFPVKSAGIISGIEGTNKVNFTEAYTGNTIKAGNYVVESYNAGAYFYPIPVNSYSELYEWVYVERYFNADGYQWGGTDSVSPGNPYSGGYIPFNTTHIGIVLNNDTNSGTDPIKFADIKLEAVGNMQCERLENKIEFKK